MIFLRIAGRLLSRVRQNIDRAISHVGPMIRYQLEQEGLHEYNWPDRPVCDYSLTPRIVMMFNWRAEQLSELAPG